MNTEEHRRIAATFSTDEIPTDERGAYLLSLPPERLKWALFDAADRASNRSDNQRFYLLQVLGWIGDYAASKDLNRVRDDAAGDIELLVPVIVEILNDEAEELARRANNP